MTDQLDVLRAPEAPRATGGMTRRQAAVLGAWAAPAIVLVGATPAVSASSTAVHSVTVVRAGGVEWSSWEPGGDGHAPGMRFIQSGTGTNTEIATITFTPTTLGAAPAPSTIFSAYDALVINPPTASGSKLLYTVSVTLKGDKAHKGITIKDNSAANGSYAVSFGSTSATFSIRGAGINDQPNQVATPARSS